MSPVYALAEAAIAGVLCAFLRIHFFQALQFLLTDDAFFLVLIYRKISPGLMFVQKAFLLGLFSGELIFGRAYY